MLLQKSYHKNKKYSTGYYIYCIIYISHLRFYWQLSWQLPYLASHSTLFKAASAHRPLLNWQMIGYASHSAGCMHTRSAFPDFRDYLKECLDISPTTCAEDIHIPFQIQQSLNDANCIPEQVFQLFTAIPVYRHTQLQPGCTLPDDTVSWFRTQSSFPWSGFCCFAA